jgi:hypothetical protein
MKFEDIHNMNEQQLSFFINELKRKFNSELSSVRDKEQKLSTQMPTVAAGNIGDINKIIWPFFFASSQFGEDVTQLAPNQSVSTYVNITQEAGFVLTKLVKTVFEVVDLGGGNYWYSYVNPKDLSSGLASDLRFTITDVQSSRSFHYAPINLDHIGDAKDPTCLKTPIYFAPNANVEVKFFNDSQTKTYVPMMMFHGYRIRIEDEQESLGRVVE